MRKFASEGPYNTHHFFSWSHVMSDVVISVEKLSKSYLLGHRAGREGHKRYSTLRDVISREIRNIARKGRFQWGSEIRCERQQKGRESPSELGIKRQIFTTSLSDRGRPCNPLRAILGAMLETSERK